MSPLVAFFLALVALSSQPTPAPSYAAARTAAIANCDAIDANAYQSGLAFNPDGYRSYYTQSECLQRTAVRFRDLELCGRVRQRRALLSSSWGYSPANCRTLVTQGVEADRRELEEIRRQYQSGVVVLRDFTLRRNGNGRDYEVLPAFEGVNGHGYIITVEIVGEDGKAVAIHSNGYYADPRSSLSLFIPVQDIRTRLAAFVPGRTYQLRVTATFSLPGASDARFMSETFVEQLFPLRDRTRSVTRAVAF